MREEMLADENVILLGEDVGRYGGAFKVSQGLWDEFGEERVIDTPLSEAAIAGAAVGAALTGMRPIAEIMYIDFMTIAMDQIVNQAAKMKYMFGGKAVLPVVFRTQEGGGKSNGAQHSQCLEAWFMHVPGIRVVIPSTPYDAKGLLKSSIREDNPVVFIEHKMLYGVKGPVPENDYLVPLGRAEVKREGRDVTLVAISMMVHKALKAAEALSREGIEAEVIDPRTLAPLDEDSIINSVKKTGRLVIVHEACKRGGVGGEIASIAAEEAFDYLDAPIKRLGALEVPIPYAPHLASAVVPDEERIVAAVKEVCR
ncbi:MAG: hypothetical protein A2147_04755 [Chloroflexi bacterium RBG_16_57_8]|nr:MAG: hypothetical protein A2147_04755 [Chloroflexi bacterium RBG_16_57_8]